MLRRSVGAERPVRTLLIVEVPESAQALQLLKQSRRRRNSSIGFHHLGQRRQAGRQTEPLAKLARTFSQAASMPLATFPPGVTPLLVVSLRGAASMRRAYRLNAGNAGLPISVRDGRFPIISCWVGMAGGAFRPYRTGRDVPNSLAGGGTKICLARMEKGSTDENSTCRIIHRLAACRRRGRERCEPGPSGNFGCHSRPGRFDPLHSKQPRFGSIAGLQLPGRGTADPHGRPQRFHQPQRFQ